jgi:eukaryotic-like serine/threonine-protein kinase
MVGRTVGTCKLVAKIGEGGMGVVYKGIDLMVEREVAIKVLRPEIAERPEVLERFRAEAIALAKLNHSHIATLYSLFCEGGEYFMVMQFVAGRTLESIIRESQPFPPELAVSIASQVLEAIDHACSNGILHRDIKPANIMLTPTAEVKVTDFGIARILGNARLTREGCAYGTLEYLSPERIRGLEGDVRSDLYSLGVVLYEMLTRQLPFKRGSEYELMRAHLEEEPPSFAALGLSSIPPRIEQAVLRALAKRPEDRFASAAEFRSALAAAITSEQFAAPALQQIDMPANEGVDSVVPRAATAGHRRSASSSKLRWAIYALVAVAVPAVVLIGVLSWNQVRRDTSVQPAPTSVESPPAAQRPQKQAAEAPDTGQPQADLSKGQQAQAPSGQSSGGKKAPLNNKRQAALDALEQDGSGASNAKKATDKDRRTRSLDALQK